MRVAIFLGHPAHFHMFKYVAANLKSVGHEVDFVIKEKDILKSLLIGAGHNYFVIRNEERRTSSKWGLIKSLVLMDIRMVWYLLRRKPDILIGTYVALLGKLTGVPIVVTNEDDAEVVPYLAITSYPLANAILNPMSCNSGRWDKKAIKYAGFQKLAYLHPRVFTPDREVVHKYFSTDRPYFLLRFAKLNAHHDGGISGITKEIALKIIAQLEPFGDIYISSERPLEDELEPYRIKINPLDMHHILAFAHIYIGDSQSMAVEAAMLGVPFIRFNDFIGKIGVLNEIENKYQLGFGIATHDVESLFSTLKNLLALPDRTALFQTRRAEMLSEKIDVSAFFTWFIEEYPESKRMMKINPDFQFKFK